MKSEKKAQDCTEGKQNSGLALPDIAIELIAMHRFYVSAPTQHPATTHRVKEKKMTRHKLKRNEFRLANDAVANIEYWSDATKVSVAAFGADGHQVSVATYQAHVDPAADLNSQLQEELIDSLANALEYALSRKPELHVRKR